MISNNTIIVFDFETSGFSEINDEPVQIAAVALDPRTLEIIPESEFNSLMKPVNILSGTEAEIRTKWNKCSGAWDINKKTRKELESAPLPEHVWKAFVDHVKKYNVAGYGGKPIPSGHNIQGFDLLWVDALCQRYKVAVDKSGRQTFLNTRTVLDTLNLAFLWFESNPEPENLKMDTLRKWFGINEVGHDALVDVKTSAMILQSFMKLHRNYAPKVKFKNAFAPKPSASN